MADIEGPVPFFHNFFDPINDSLDVPKPGVWSVAHQDDFDPEDSKKKVALDVEASHEPKASKKDNVFKLSSTLKLRLKGDSVFGTVALEKATGFPIPGVQFVCDKERAHALTLNMDKIIYDYVHPTFAVHARSSFMAEGGLPLHVSLATCLQPRTFAGVCVDYDALRAGLKKFYAAVQHTSEDGKSIFTLSVDGRCHPGVTVVHELLAGVKLLADIFPAQRKFAAGVQFEERMSPHGGNVLVRGDWYDRLLTVAYTNKTAMWNVGISGSWSMETKDPWPQVGVRLTAE